MSHFWNGSFLMYLSRSASPFGSAWDNSPKPSSSTKQISWPFGSAKMITRTSALPGVGNEINGVKMFWLLSLIIWLISGWVLCGTANAIRPNACLRSKEMSAIWVEKDWLYFCLLFYWTRGILLKLDFLELSHSKMIKNEKKMTMLGLCDNSRKWNCSRIAFAIGAYVMLFT